MLSLSMSTTTPAFMWSWGFVPASVALPELSYGFSSNLNSSLLNLRKIKITVLSGLSSPFS